MPRLRRLLAAAPALVIATTATAQRPEPIKFARFPHVANDGTIAFTYQDDIWVASPDGSNPRRLTANVARDFSPRFSPDGQWIAFTSNRMGNNDVYVVPTSGGEPRQLTYFSGDDQALYWAPDGRSIVMASARGPHPFGSPMYRVALDGSVPVPMGMDFGRSGMIKQDATLVAFNRNLPTYWRKGYRGNNSADIAVQDVRTGEITEITDTNLQEFRGHVNDVHPMWGADGMLYFASERDGTFNIWRIASKGGPAQQVTRHKEDGVQFPAISPDGRRIIYENDFDLWTLDVPNGTPKKVNLSVVSDAKENDVAVITADSRADGFSPSPNGEYLAVDVHGEIVSVPTDQGFGEKTQVTSSPWRERFQTYSPDGRKIAYVSDESGEEEVWVWDMATAAKRKLTTHESVKADLTWSPNSTKLAYTAANRLWEVDAAGGDARELAYNPAGGFSIQQYSSDGNWIVYSHRDDDQNADVYVFDVRAKREYNVSKSPFNELAGAITSDGKTVVFTSNRDDGVTHLFAVSLAKVTEDPNDPLVRERRRRERPDTASPPPIRVDVDGIDRRAVQLTRGSQPVSGFFLSRDGRTVFFATGAGGFGGGGQQPPADSASASEHGLFSVSIEGRDRRRIATGTFAGLTPTIDRRTVFFRRNAPQQADDDASGPPTTAGVEIHRLSLPAGGGAAAAASANTANAPAGGGARAERVRFSFPVRVDRRAEWNQTFEEAWRVMKYRFYDEKMHGRDWAAIKARYKPLLKYVGTNEDLYDLANEMIGELNASHTGVSGPPTRPMPRAYTTRFLGFELEPANGRYKVSHIYRGGPADKEWIDLKVGDYVLAIDGKELKAGDNYWKTLSETLNEYIPVRVAKTPNGDGAKTLRINSVTSLTDIKYEEWVANNRDFVEKESNGDIAYVHIRSMNQPSLARFRNEIDQFANKKGIVVDIRFNGGGNIDQELIDILERKPYQFWNARNGSRTWGRRPRQAIAGPKVMLVNNRSGSDSEVTPMGFRQLGLGRIVGNPTAAAVIATGSYTLINGGAIRTPGSLVITYDPTKPNNYGVNLENYGVPPDVWVENSPMDQLKGFDRELKVAVDEAKKMMKQPPEPPKVVQ
jgi:tricorn protease